MAGNEVLEHRWGFLSSWCALLKKRISYTWPGREEEMWDLQKRQLSVSLPTHFDASDSEESEEDLFFFDEEDDDNFRRKFQNLREALALLSAVAHVDQSAWKYLLTTYCGLKFDNEDDEIPAQFQIYLNLEGRESLKWADTFDFDLVKICGTHQRKHPSRNYLNALKRIAFWDGIINGGGRMDLPGKDIYIPVRPYFGGLYIKSVDGPMEVMMDIWRAEEKIRIKWAKYNQKQPDQRIAPGQIRCTFVLEPVIADFNDNMLLPEMAETTEWLITNNQWFSQFSLWLQFDHERSADAYGKAKVFGRLMKAVFDSNYRRRMIANVSGQFNGIRPVSRDSSALQLGTVHLECAGTLRSKEFEAMCSALVVNRTTKKLSMRLEMDAEDQTNSNQWWKWLAYGLFSKRARVCSSLETLSLMSICSLSEEDMSAFAAVLSSDHPEEELCGCPRGKMVEREATLKRDAPIRWQFNDRGQYRSGSELLRFATPVNFVRTFSDDGKSNWVDALIPGYGRCQVLRNDLIFHSEEAKTDRGRLKSLNISFCEWEASESAGLPRFLELIGQSLEYLSLDSLEVDVADICRYCPNLKELTFNAGVVSARLNFEQYHAKGDPIPTIRGSWYNINTLSTELSVIHSPLTQSVRRLRARMNGMAIGFDSMFGTHYHPRIEIDLKALLKMLDVNTTLEYVDVIVPSKYEGMSESFRKRHLAPTSHASKLSTNRKVAFISVMTGFPQTKRTTRRTERLSRARSTLSQLDQFMLSKIFEFAAPPIPRQVVFRKKKDSYDEDKSAPL